MSKSLILEFAEKEQQLKELQEAMNKMQADPRLQVEMEFKDRLETLMRDFDKSANDVITLLSPTEFVQRESKPRKKRKLKVYKNPHTGEVIETRGANHKGLKGWKSEYGDEAVESWLVAEAEE